MGWKTLSVAMVGLGVAFSAVGSEGWVHPDDLQQERISFFDLKPTDRLSPFKELKEYSGEPSGMHDFQALIQYHQERLELRERERETNENGERTEEVSLPLETRVSVTHDTAYTTKDPHQVSDEFGDCSSLRPLEPLAILGRLSPEQVGCLEARITFSKGQTEKAKISRILMANAFASGNGTHVHLLKRHLESIDRSDPDLTYKYAYALSKEGDKNLKDVIYWSDIALERRDQWSSSVYTRRVYTTMKMRANAAYRRWKMSEEAYAAAPIARLNSEKNRRRGEAKTYAREWLTFASAAEMDTTTARRMCVSVSGTDAYCN